MVSYNPNDIAAGYCGNCHEFTGEPPGAVGYPQHGDPLDRQWHHGGHPMHRDLNGHPITMRQWMELQNDGKTRIQALDQFEDGTRVVTIWTGLWDSTVHGGGGFDTIHQYGSNALSHLRRSSQFDALEAHRTLVHRLVQSGRVLKENP